MVRRTERMNMVVVSGRRHTGNDWALARQRALLLWSHRWTPVPWQRETACEGFRESFGLKEFEPLPFDAFPNFAMLFTSGF